MLFTLKFIEKGCINLKFDDDNSFSYPCLLSSCFYIQSFTLYNDGAASIPYAVDEKEIKHYLKVSQGLVLLHDVVA